MITVRNFETITSRWEDGIKMDLQENVFYSHPSQYNTINAVNIFKKCDSEVWTGLIWLRIGTDGGLL